MGSGACEHAVRLRPPPKTGFLYLESEEELDGVCKTRPLRQTDRYGQSKEQKVEEGPGEGQRWGEPLGDRERQRYLGGAIAFIDIGSNNPTATFTTSE